MSTAFSLPISNDIGFKAHFETELFAAPKITTLQINIGYVCNLACRHCHVESSPARTAPHENMQQETAEKVVDWALNQSTLDTIDITGGSPEMNPNFQWMVKAFRQAGLAVIDRCNPTIITHVEKKTGRSFDWIPQFLADHHVRVVASLPCYTADNVDHQRGRGSYDNSVEGLLRLNDVGYGSDPNLSLTLVYNPNGPHLPPGENALEDDYKRELKERFGIVFNQLITITNMPIKRWRHELERDNQLEEYMSLLISAYNPATIDGLMCRNQISISPTGRLYDCDFNQAIDMPTPQFKHDYLWNMTMADLEQRIIATDDHCYGCTAGTGSSCGGSLVE